MANPVLNERTLRSASTTWAPPERGSGHFPPVNDGPMTPWTAKVMTVSGTISATATLVRAVARERRVRLAARRVSPSRCS